MTWVGQKSEVVVSHDELIPRINALPRVTGLRSKWLYNNWMYALAGVIIERKSTEGSYLDFMNELIFKKFGLSRTCLRRDDVPDANISRAYAAAQTGEAMIIEEPPWEDSPFTPEGGIRSSVCDMVTWARHLLEAEAFETAHGSDRTTHEHTTPLHPGGIFAPKMILPDGVSVGRLERTYAMGFMRLMLPSRLWFGGGRNDTVAANVAIPPISPAPANAGHHTLALSHCGENAGQLSSFVLLPEQDAAVIVLGNTTALGDANELITHLLVSQIVGSTEEAVVDYPSLAQRIAAQCKDWHKTVISDPLAQHRISGTAVSGPLNDYVGRYKDPASGFTMTIAREHDRDRLVLHQGGRPSQRAPLHHYHFDTFTFATESYDEHMRLGMIDFDDWRILLIRFERGWDGSVSALRWFLDPDFPPASLLKVK